MKQAADFPDADLRVFVALVPGDASGLLALNGDAPEVHSLAAYTESRVRYFGLDHPENDVTATDVATISEGQGFTLLIDDVPVTDLFLPGSGRHNLMNALAACTPALDAGLTAEQLAEGFASFQGMKRRQEVRGEAGGVLVVDAEAVVRRITARGSPAAVYPNADTLLDPLADTLRPGDVALIMSNGGFGNLHERLLQRLHATV